MSLEMISLSFYVSKFYVLEILKNYLADFLTVQAQETCENYILSIVFI